MKQATCRELRGACDQVITGKTPEEMGAKSKQHVMEMLQAGDQSHIDAVESMRALSPSEQMNWQDDFARHFEDLAEA